MQESKSISVMYVTNTSLYAATSRFICANILARSPISVTFARKDLDKEVIYSTTSESMKVRRRIEHGKLNSFVLFFVSFVAY